VKTAVPQSEMVIRGLAPREPVRVPWRAAFESLPAPALLLGANGTLIACNAAARVVLGPAARIGTRCCRFLGCRPPGEGLGAGWDALTTVAAAAATVVGFVLPFAPLLVLAAALGWWLRRRARTGVSATA